MSWLLRGQGNVCSPCLVLSQASLVNLSCSKGEFSPVGLAGKGISLAWFWVRGEGSARVVPVVPCGILGSVGPSIPTGTCRHHPLLQTFIPGDVCREAGKQRAGLDHAGACE